ncbi:phage tail protein [Nocardioides exalbidus]|uniref:phage tail protein n=1 Tax=Nocardioides exalbidus TaxID=402596 RepID=UPI001C31E16B|nr:tail fiber protein [Nocardioides exalbidus]
MAEINLFPFNFCPKGWAWCNGQLLPIWQNTALFSLLGTTYGGDGKSTFALPNLNGNVAMHPNQGPGLSLHDLGETSGTESVTLLQSEIPVHAHQVNASTVVGTSANPVTAYPGTTELPVFHSATSANGPLQPAGGDQPHNNMQPYLTLYYAIALQGVFPPRW